MPKPERQQQVLDLLKGLRGVEPLKQLFWSELNYQRVNEPLSRRGWTDSTSKALADDPILFAGGGENNDFHVIYGRLASDRLLLGNERPVVSRLVKEHPYALFVFSNKAQDRWHFLNVKYDDTAEKRRLFRRITVGPEERLRTASERISLLSLDAISPELLGIAPLTIQEHHDEAFDKEPITREFFKRFEVALEAVKADLEKYQSLPSAQAYSRSQLLLERLVFLYFLQNRGWLDQQRDYLVGQFQPYRQKSDKFTYYEEFLDKLFWTLASPPGAQERLSGIPFLNGGLFDDDEFTPTPLRRKQNPPLRIRNETFAVVFDDFLEAFNFTVREDTPLDQDVAVDPEMLGKVFESIVLHAEAADPDAVAPDKRKATGSYYTPRIVVHFICRESLYQYLTNHLTGPNWPDRLKQILALNADDGLDPDELKKLRDLLTPAEGTQLLNLLASLKCCDPAVGSGAFPVGLMHELMGLRRIAAAAANGYVDPVRKDGNVWLHETKADIVENSLYGVDIQQQAIEICRLRLWLSLIVDYDLGVDPFTADRAQFRDAIGKISQLPNLEMNFRRGDSLLDMVSNVPIRVDSNVVSRYRDHVEKIQKLGHDLHRARKAERKKNLRLDILGRRFDLTGNVLTDELKSFQTEDANLTATLFGDLSRAERERRKEIAHEIGQLQQALDKLQADRKELEKLASRSMASDFYYKLRRLEGADFDSPFNFAWRIDFPTILTASKSTLAGEMTLVNESQRQQELTAKQSAVTGGFDIVVGNPPFVTARNPVKRELYRERWPLVCHGTYQLVCPFFELSFSLLKASGQLGFIVSNAFAKREFGKPLVEDFFPTLDLQKIMDCSGLMFPGHGTPTCLVFGSNRKPDPKNPLCVAAILPGGGDLRTAPEESPLWHALAEHHDQPGYAGERVVVAERNRSDMAKWPLNFDASTEPTKRFIEKNTERSSDFTASFGSMFDTHKDDVFEMPADRARRLGIEKQALSPFAIGDQLRNWQLQDFSYILKPYDEHLKLRKTDNSGLFAYLCRFRAELGSRAVFGGGTYDQAGEPWYRYHQMSVEKITAPFCLIYPEIATHAHVLPQARGFLFTQTVPLLCLASNTGNHNALVAAVLNSSAALFWLKQLCFNKGAGEDEHLDRFKYAGAKIQQLPMPAAVADALRGKSNGLSERLTALSQACWERGRQMPSLSLKKLFEKEGEAYHGWNASLPGHVAPQKEIAAPFTTAAELRKRYERTQSIRETLRAEMIALQEEMDWLVYRAYELTGRQLPLASFNWSDPRNLDSVLVPLSREDRPFRAWAKAEGNLEKACALIPTGKEWSEERRTVWQARLVAIRDNEHIRRIEQPVYKRRWDEQWKVGNRWTCGPAAYAAELVDAFNWWLAEKAEWHLEKKAGGGPLDLETWTDKLWSDARIQAAWPVIAEAIAQVEAHKATLREDKGGQGRDARATTDASVTAFARFFRDLVNAETVPEGIPSAVP